MDAARAVVDFILHIDVHLAELSAEYGVWLYAILFLIVFAETGFVVTPFLPGDSLLFAAGALCATEGSHLSPHLLVLLLLAAAILGDALNYSIGRRLGDRAYKARFVKPEYLQRTAAFFEKYGPKTIVLARFVPIVRTFAPFVAGIGQMKYRTFATYNLIGALLWVPTFVYAGYFFGNLPVVKENFGLVVIGVIVVSVVPMAVEYLRHRRSARAARGSAA